MLSTARELIGSHWDRRRRCLLAVLVLGLMGLIGPMGLISLGIGHADEPAAKTEAQPTTTEVKPVQGERWALILIGLPGDADHEALFTQTAGNWQTWLTETLDFPADHVVRIPVQLPESTDAAKADKASKTVPLTSEAIQLALDDLKKKLRPDDTLWVLTLGHGNYDGKRAWFHVSGKDPSMKTLAVG